MTVSVHKHTCSSILGAGCTMRVWNQDHVVLSNLSFDIGARCRRKIRSPRQISRVLLNFIQESQPNFKTLKAIRDARDRWRRWYRVVTWSSSCFCRVTLLVYTYAIGLFYFCGSKAFCWSIISSSLSNFRNIVLSTACSLSTQSYNYSSSRALHTKSSVNSG